MRTLVVLSALAFLSSAAAPSARAFQDYPGTGNCDKCEDLSHDVWGHVHTFSGVGAYMDLPHGDSIAGTCGTFHYSCVPGQQEKEDEAVELRLWLAALLVDSGVRPLAAVLKQRPLVISLNADRGALQFRDECADVVIAHLPLKDRRSVLLFSSGWFDRYQAWAAAVHVN
jgi:hypothetical protein